MWRIRGEKSCATRRGGVPDVECRVGKGSDDGDGGVWNEFEGRKSRGKSTHWAEQPICVEHCRRGREETSLERNRGAPNQSWGWDWGGPIQEEERWEKSQYGVLNDRSPNPEWGAPMGIEERLLLRGCTIGGGGMNQPTMCNWWVQWLLQQYNLSLWKGKFYLEIHLGKT